MGFTPELQRDFLKKDLGPILEAAGYGRDKLDVMICDDQRNKVHVWADTILKDKVAAKYVSGTAFHFYANKPENVGNLDKTHEIDPNRYILNTEASHNEPTLGFWPFLEDFSKDIIIV
jgi:glucosylceramidase